MAHDNHDARANVATGKLVERRFTADPTGRSNIQALLGGLGAAALGAGAYATWMHDVPMTAAPYLFAAGALGLIAGAVIGTSDATPLRVGDAGVGVERGGAEPERIGWFEVDKVALEGKDRVVVEGARKRIVAPAAHHAQAAAWILKEALARIPKRVSIDADKSNELLHAAGDQASVVAIEPPQLAGRRCKASGTIISFERDARTCERCGEVYDKKHAPEKCLTCEAPMNAS